MKIALFLLLIGNVFGNVFAQDTAPVQDNLKTPFVVAEKNGYKIEALAKFELTARVLAIESYSWDKESDIAPVDLALGWQQMAQPEFLSKIKITQSHRFYYWYTKDDIIYSQKNKIISQSANMHLIPADKKVEKMISKAKKEKNIYLKGYLVRASKDNWRWTSSLTRQDTGRGACELFYVTEALPIF